MNREKAETVGESLDVTLRIDRTGRAVNLKLTKRVFLSVAIYTTDQPVVFDKPLDIVGPSDLIKSPWDNIAVSSLKAQNDDTIVVSYGDANTTFTVYDSYVQLGIAMNEEKLLEKLAELSAGLLDAKTRAEREARQERVEMIKNARHIINDYKPPAGNPLDVTFRDPYTDFTRYFIGKRYLDLIEKSGPDRDDYTGMRSWQKIPPVHDRQFDIWYTREIERREIGSAIADGRKFYGKLFDEMLRHELLEGGLVAGKSLVAMALVTLNSIVIVRFGKNIWGERVDKSERLLAGVGLASQGLLMGLDAYIKFRGTLQEMMALRRYNKSGRPGVKLFGPGNPAKIRRPGAIPKGEVETFRRWPDEDDFVKPIPARPFKSAGTPFQLDPRFCGHMAAEGVLRDLKLIDKLRTEADLTFLSLEAGAMDILDPEIGMWPEEMATWLEHHGCSVKFLKNPTLRQIQKEIDNGGKVLQVVSTAAPGEERYLHWVRNEGLDCKRMPGKINVSVGDPWDGQSSLVRGYVYAKRMYEGSAGDPLQRGWTIVVRAGKKP